VNVNTATAADLEALLASRGDRRIVDHRTANGPFTSVEQLLDVSGIGDSILESIRELVTV
jgi:competence protein ComEA